MKRQLSQLYEEDSAKRKAATSLQCIEAFMRQNRAFLDSIFWNLHKDVFDWSVTDRQGMTILHHAARSQEASYVRACLRVMSQLCNVQTFATCSPGRWLPIHCLADVGKIADETSYAELIVELAEHTSCEMLVQKTNSGSTILHLLASKGRARSLEAILEGLSVRLSKADLAEMINTQVGKDSLGCVDMALKCCKASVPSLKWYGGREQTEAPWDWSRGRRRPPRQ